MGDRKEVSTIPPGLKALGDFMRETREPLTEEEQARRRAMMSPSPWRVRERGGDYLIEDANGETICRTFNVRAPYDALAISRAPEMLDLLREAMEALEGDRSMDSQQRDVSSRAWARIRDFLDGTG